MSRTAAVLTISDLGARGERIDTSGPAVCALLEGAGFRVIHTKILPDEYEQIVEALSYCADALQVPLTVTTGGTGFALRDVTPEATLAVIEREARGIPEAMRAASMKITPRGCLSRGVAGLRGKTLIMNLPGSKKAAVENLEAVLPALAHGLDMLGTVGSANCGINDGQMPRNQMRPSMDQWISEAKKDKHAGKVGMYLTHNGVVRETAKATVRDGADRVDQVTGMVFSYEEAKVAQAVEETKQREGIYYVRVWLNEGTLAVGEDLMYVLIGGDIRPRVVEALEFLVGKLKTECVTETEIYME